MKNIFYILFLILNFSIASAQIDLEMKKIGFYPHIISSKGIHPAINELLLSKVNNIILQNSLGDIDNNQFVLLTKIDFIEESVTPTVPPVFKMVYNIQFTIADNIMKHTYGTYNLRNCIGINKNKQVAIRQAMGRVRSNKRIVNWLNSMKELIVDSYKNNCMMMMMEIDALEGQKKYDEAIDLLTKIPKISEYCFTMAQQKMVDLFKKKGIEMSQPKDDIDSLDIKETFNSQEEIDKESDENYEWIIDNSESKN